MTSSLNIRENVDITQPSWKVPLECIHQVAAFSVGALDFKTYLNVSLCCKEVRQSLKVIFDEPTIVWDKNTPLSHHFYEACTEFDIDDYLERHGDDMPNQALFWPKVQYVKTSRYDCVVG
jgi:hypothetical protein